MSPIRTTRFFSTALLAGLVFAYALAAPAALAYGQAFPDSPRIREGRSATIALDNPPGQSQREHVTADHVVINEILAHTDSPQRDSIELYNPTAAPVALDGWFLSDSRNELDRYKIAAKVVIQPGGFRVFTDQDFAFGLSEFGETVYLSAPGPGGAPGALVDKAQFGASPNGISFGRYETSDGAVHYPLLRAVSLGGQNDAPLASALVVTELMYHPASGNEYVIVKNQGTAAQPFFDVEHPANRWKLLLGGTEAFVFPADLWLAPGRAVVITGGGAAVAASPARVRASLEVIGQFQGRLSNEGERVSLQAPQPPELDGVVAYVEMDGVDYGVGAPWPGGADGTGLALRRVATDAYADDPVNWQAGLSSLGDWPTMYLPVVTRR